MLPIIRGNETGDLVYMLHIIIYCQIATRKLCFYTTSELLFLNVSMTPLKNMFMELKFT